MHFGFRGFVYAIASAACEFLYRKNNEYYEIKIKKTPYRSSTAAEMRVARTAYFKAIRRAKSKHWEDFLR